MDLTEYLLGAVVAGALGFAVYWVMRLSQRRHKRSASRGVGSERGWMLDLARGAGASLQSFFPARWEGIRRRDAERLEKAGLYPKWDSEELVGLQFFGGIYGLIATELILFPGNHVLGLVGAVIGAWLPRWYVKRKRKERQWEIIREFPTAIDMIVLGLEGGLDVTAGIKEMIENSEGGALRSEFQRLHRDISMGETRANAFRALSRRMDSIEIRAVMISIVQAMEMGSEIGPLMRTQSEQLRFNRLMRAEEAANKAPTKMMIPMALFILPCMFLVIFAPIGISLVRSLGQLGD